MLDPSEIVKVTEDLEQEKNYEYSFEGDMLYTYIAKDVHRYVQKTFENQDIPEIFGNSQALASISHFPENLWNLWNLWVFLRFLKKSMKISRFFKLFKNQ